MKIITRSKVFVAFICLVALSSCNNYGKKVTFTDNKGEVYYKGDGVTEADAKAVGNFLKEQKYFDNDKARSVQITKDSGHIKARFVVNEKALATIKNADESFALIGAMMSKNVFNNMPVDVIYTDDAFKDIKTIPYKASELGQVNAAEEIKQMLKKEHKQNTLYYSKDFTEPEADTLFNYFVSSGFFSEEGNNDILVNKIPGGLHLKFSIKDSFNNAEGLQKVDDFVKELKKDLYANVTIEFEAMDENMQHIKTFTY